VQAKSLRPVSCQAHPRQSAPDGLTDEQVLFLSDIFPTDYMAADFCDIQPGDTIAIWGCGPAGQMAIKSAFILGAERVIAIDTVPERLALAEKSDPPRFHGQGHLRPDHGADQWSYFWRYPAVIFTLSIGRLAYHEQDRRRENAGGNPADWLVGDKTGVNDDKNGNLNDVAVIWPPNASPIIVAAYCQIPGVTADQRNAVVAEIGQTASRFRTGGTF
jgi:hypothetical protein